jgi:hypothetical protein
MKGKRVMIKRGEIGHVVVLCLTPPTASNGDEDYGVDNSP